MALRLDVYDDFHLHGASAPEWNQRYLQMSPGAMRSTLAEAVSGRLHVFRKWMSQRVVQQGCLPPGRRCFAVLAGATGGTPRAQGHELTQDGLFLLRGGEEFTLQRPEGMELLAVTFDDEELRRLLDASPWPKAARELLARPVLLAPPAAVQRFRDELRAVLAARGADATGPGAHGATEAIYAALGALLAEAAGPHRGVGSASAAYIVAECHRLVASSGEAPPSIDALCRRLRTSRRSLQQSFQQVADTTPLHYLRSLRLNAVRGRLLATGPEALSIAQAAEDQGFQHLSHFAARYEALFGELPSRTTRGADPQRS